MTTNLSHARLPLRCWAEIDLDALERNLRLIRASLPAHMRYVAVVKADAYGHGLHQASAALMHAGADLFAVANITEAAALRELSSNWPILMLSPVIPDEDRFLVQYDVAATISTLDEVARFDAVARNANRPLQVHLKIDTGMGRLGVWHTEARALYEKLLCCRNDVGLLAEEYDPVAKRQLGNFPQAFSHLSLINTANSLKSAFGPTQQRAAGGHRVQ